MRRIRFLSQADCPVHMKPNIGSRVVLPCGGIVLERSWHDKIKRPVEVFINAKFNTTTMQGIEIQTGLMRSGSIISSNVLSANIYLLSDSGMTETLVYSPAFTASGSFFVSTVTQANFGSNELSGRETYAIQVKIQRARKTYVKKVWFNHLGCYDNLIRLKQDIELNNILKVDE